MIRYLLSTLVVCFSGCRMYQQGVMFRLDDQFTSEDLSKVKNEVEGNYRLRPDDALFVDVFTNKGEPLLDPYPELQIVSNEQRQKVKDRFQYVIQADGTVLLPIIGSVTLKGLTLNGAENTLAKRYSDIYKDAFVKLRINNRRVFVLGAPGGRVIPVTNENTTLFEVLAGVGDFREEAKVHNIKLIRGEKIFRIDLSTISGMRETNMQVQPDDVIYVEPWRRPWLEGLKDIAPVLSTITSVLTVIVLIQNTTRNTGN